jgi:osmotically-inducible protein OsmY
MKSIKYYSVFFLALIGLGLAGCASNGEHHRDTAEVSQTPGAYMDDSLITTKVKTAIFNEPGLDVAEISVETYQGVVQLSGFVESESDISRAVEVAQRVEGVKSVKNDMRLKSTRTN